LFLNRFKTYQSAAGLT